MFKKHYIGKIGNIPILAEGSAIFLILCIVYLFSSFLIDTYGLLYSIIFSSIASVIFCISVVAHELAHARCALRYGVWVEFIELNFAGGAAYYKSNCKSAKNNVLISAAGPMSNIIIGIFFATLYGLMSLLSTTNNVYNISVDSIGILALANISVALYNLLPSSNLDGFHILHGILVYNGYSFSRAMDICLRVGKIVPIIIIVIGMFGIFVCKFVIISSTFLAFISTPLVIIGVMLFFQNRSVYKKIN